MQSQKHQELNHIFNERGSQARRSLTNSTNQQPPSTTENAEMPCCQTLPNQNLCFFTCKNNKKKLKQQGIEDKQHQLSLSWEGKRPKNVHIYCKMNSIVKKSQALINFR